MISLRQLLRSFQVDGQKRTSKALSTHHLAMTRPFKFFLIATYLLGGMISSTLESSQPGSYGSLRDSIALSPDLAPVKGEHWERCANPRLVSGQPVLVVILLDGAPSAEKGGEYYPFPVSNTGANVPIVSNYCPVEPSGHDRHFPPGLDDNIRRWSELSTRTSPYGSSSEQVTRACTSRDDNSDSGLDKSTCLVAQLADLGAIIIPYSYAGVHVEADHKVVVESYNEEDSKQALEKSVEVLDEQISSIHVAWKKTRIALVGHSFGGLVAEDWWFNKRQQPNSNHRGVVHVFSLDAPINGVAKCDWATIPYADAAKDWCDRWNNRYERDLEIIEADKDASYTAVGNQGDPTYGDDLFAGGGDLVPQVIYKCTGDGSAENCIASDPQTNTPSYVISNPLCTGSGGNIKGTTGHDLVKVCPSVVDLIVDTMRTKILSLGSKGSGVLQANHLHDPVPPAGCQSSWLANSLVFYSGSANHVGLALHTYAATCAK